MKYTPQAINNTKVKSERCARQAAEARALEAEEGRRKAEAVVRPEGGGR